MARTPAAAPAPTGPRLNLPIFLLALVGVLVVVHLWIQVERGFTHGCLGFSAPTGEIAECSEVVSSDAGSVLGFSNVFLGLAFYLGIAVLRFGAAAVRGPLAQRLRYASTAVVSVGFLYAAWLLVYQAAVLDRYCVLCLISAGVTATLFALHLVELRKKPREVEAALPLKPYAIAAAVLVAVAGADVVFNSDAAEAAPVPVETAQAPERAEPAGPVGPATVDPSQCHADPTMNRLANVNQLLDDDVYLGAENAPVRVVKIFDPNCPHCKTLHGVLDGTLAEIDEQARVYYQPYPIWDFSFPQVQALYIAREEGKYFDMLELQFEAQQELAALRRQDPRGGLVLDRLAEMADQLGMDGEALRRDVQNRKYVGSILQEKQLMAETGIPSVPKLFIDGEAMVNTAQSWSTACISQLVAAEYEAAGAPGTDPVGEPVSEPVTES
ncbi:MAG: vitamin K epoxide reductase family protein [Rhodothermales bacterium]|nr:vitamin K epoxide reductase family protein [Rhodothermales bacterium]